MKKSTISFAIFFLIGSGITVWTAWAAHREEQRFIARQLALQRQRHAWDEMKHHLAMEIRSFPGKAAVWVEDLRTGWKAGDGVDVPFPAASLVKLAILAAYLQASEEGTVDLAEWVVLRQQDKVGGSGKLKEMPAGSRFTVEELLRHMIAHSDNTATNLLIQRMGMDRLNEAFAELGLKGTHLARMMMDFGSRRNGLENVTTAWDVADLLRRIYHGQLVSPEASHLSLSFLSQQALRDRIPARLPAGVRVANKTGLERGVCHDAGIVWAPQRALLICVLTKHEEKTSQAAKRFIARVAERAYAYGAFSP